jgi:hypothetical protein
MTGFINDDCAGASEEQAEGAKHFSAELFHCGNSCQTSASEQIEMRSRRVCIQTLDDSATATLSTNGLN